MEKYYYAGLRLLGVCQNRTGELLYFPVKKSALALLALSLFTAGSSTAMSLGRYKGAALVGRPLDISVQAVLDAQDDPAALCIEADAFYADNKLDKSLVRVSTEKAMSSPLDTVIRIRSSVLVDEPVVTLNVRVGCQKKSERRYVILADLASEPSTLLLQSSSSASASTSGANAGASNLSPPSVTSGNTSAGRAVASASARASSPRPVATSSGDAGSRLDAAVLGQAAVSKTSKPVPSVKVDKPQATGKDVSGQSVAGKARLVLEPLDLSIERSPQLKTSKELLSVPPAGEPQRLAAAALWRALTAQPQDVMKDAEKIQALENALNSSRAQAQKNQLALNELNSQLEKTRAQQYANWLVYVLGSLLLLALAGLVYLWRLRARPDAAPASALPWWRKNKPLEKGWKNTPPDAAFMTASDSAYSQDTLSPESKKKDKKNIKKNGKKNTESALGADESAFTEVRHISRLGSDFQLSSSSSLDFTASMPQVARSVKAEELFDVQQQADFFVSLGQNEQAVELLRGHIEGNTQTSPLVYMDLFDLYHQLDRQVDYEALRKDFNQLFTGKVPAFDKYMHTSAGLEAYPVALTRIEALWPSPKVLEVIEESILRKPVSSADTFDLEAYRELLLLYAVAKELVHPQDSKDSGELRFELPDISAADSAARIHGFSLTKIDPLSTNVDKTATADLDLLLPPQSPRLALDVDLSNLGPSARMPSTNIGIPPNPSATPNTNTNTNTNAKFFARLGTKMPASAPVRSSVPVAPSGLTGPSAPAAQAPAAQAIPDLYAASTAASKASSQHDNLIDFDDLDVFIKNLGPSGPSEPPKAQ